MSRQATSKRGMAALGIVVAVFCLAPSAGNIGSCGQEAVLLDEEKFFAAKNALDCARCEECGIATKVCATACAGGNPALEQFPDGCVPLVHDGEVCLDALRASTCDEYEAFVSDVGATIPTECNFCPPEAQPTGGGSP